MKFFTKFIIIVLLTGGFTFAQSYHTITIDGTNDFTNAEEFGDISHDGASGQKGYITWDADYFYFGISDAEADYNKLATFMYFDTDPVDTNGTTNAFAWGENIVTSFSCDYVVVWKNETGADYIEVRQWNSSTSSWDRVASATSTSLNDGNYVVDFSIGTDFREVRVKRSTIGSPSEIKFCSFTEQQWGNHWRYFTIPCADWTDGDRGVGDEIQHYEGFTLDDGYDPGNVNSYDYIMRKNYAFLKFDGSNDYVKYTDDATLGLLDGATDYTIEAWVKIKSGAGKGRIVHRYSLFSLFYDPTNDRLGFSVDDNGDASWAIYYTKNNTLSDDEQWHHVAVIRNTTPDPNEFKMYIDGVEQTDGTWSAYALRNEDDRNLYIGFDGVNDDYFEGAIDEVRLLNIAVDPSDLHYSKTDNAYMKNANTAVLLHFDEGTGYWTENFASGVDARLGGTGDGDAAEPTWETDVSALPQPVELVSFTAIANGDVVTLNWQTVTEVNNYGFEVERQKTKGESNWETIGFVDGAGNSNSPKAYTFTDNVSKSGTYSYRLKQIDLDGAYEYSNVVEVNVGAPEKFELMQNYPNPFNPTTTIKYSIPTNAGVETQNLASLRIYNILGEEVATLVNKTQSPGNYTVQFDATNLASGVYFYTLRVGNFTATKKMILMK